jgi:hypothetical protein
MYVEISVLAAFLHRLKSRPVLNPVEVFVISAAGDISSLEP